jgi:hypothetical protein
LEEPLPPFAESPQQLLCICSRGAFIAAILFAHSLTISQANERFQVVGMAIPNSVPVREFVTFRALCNTGFECTLSGISTHVVNAFRAVSFEQEPGLFHTKSGQLLKISAFHRRCLANLPMEGIRQREDGQIQRNQHERHENAHADHDAGFDQTEHGRHAR